MNDIDTTRWKESAALFRDFVWPVFSDRCGGGVLQMVEMERDLGKTSIIDVYAGVDALQIVGRLGVRGIASRVQWMRPGVNPYNSFTIRYKLSRSNTVTELQKRQEAIKNGTGLYYPHFTCQAYFLEKSRGLLSAAIIRTDELYAYIDEIGGPDKLYSLTNSEDGNQFKAVFWSKLKSFPSLICYPMVKGLASQNQPSLF